MTQDHPEYIHKKNEHLIDKKKEKVKEKVLCTLCGKSFRRDVLPKHTKLVHLRKKDYECDLCGEFTILK